MFGMTDHQKPWSPTDDQMNFHVHPVWDDITSQLEELQKELGCPDEYLAGMLEAMAERWSR